MLVQNPELIAVLAEQGIDWECLDFKGADKFKAILQVLLAERPASTAVLLEHYRGHPDEGIIRQLAALRLEVPIAGMAEEFSGAWDKLLEQGIDARFNRLLAKVESGKASEQEKIEFKTLSMHGASK
jgi:DNA primase